MSEAVDDPVVVGPYQPSKLRKPENVADLGRDTLGLHHIFGHDVSRRGNLKIIDSDRIIYATSAAVVLENVSTGKKDFVLGIEEAGVGCVEVHPSRKYFAVGGRGFQAKIYIYSYPDLEIRKILQNGAERGYSCLSFSADGCTLASVSTSPDYMLTIWDWESEQMGLHAKAFGQDVWNVRFSQDDPRRLTTSGIGHIRFWKMAATFTGLKLQGSIGKFGKVDLSDIEHFVELPDGKVISGTESGSLLLWEGNFIKCRFVRDNGMSCHDSAITFIDFDRAERAIVTASLDGKLRWWDFSVMDAAEVDSDHSMDFLIAPLAEFSLSSGVGVKSMLDSGLVDNTRFFIVMDSLGRLQKISFNLQSEVGSKSVSLLETMRNENKSMTATTFSEFHSDAITGVDSCPVDHLVATCGLDGVVRCLDYVNRLEISKRTFASAATCLKWLNTEIDPTGKSFSVGFSDGVIRILSIGAGDGGPTLLRRLVFKPHSSSVTDIVFSNSGEYMASSGKDGIVFVQRCRALVEDQLISWEPLRFVSLADLQSSSTSLWCNSISWSLNEKQLLLSCSDSVCRELDISQMFDAVNNIIPSIGSGDGELSEKSPIEEEFTYKISLPSREITPTLLVMTNSKSGLLTIVKPNRELAVPIPQQDPESPSKSSKQTTLPADNLSDSQSHARLKVSLALHAYHRQPGAFLSSASLSTMQYIFCETNLIDSASTIALSCGAYSETGKDALRNPIVTAMRYGWSHKFLVTGTSDGSVVVRPSEQLEVFCRSSAQNSSSGGVSRCALSFDDRFVITAGNDGNLVVHKIRLDLIMQRATGLFKDLDAGVFGDEIYKHANPAIPIAEPRYLTITTSYMITEEDTMFAPSALSKKEMSILKKPLFNPLEEYADIAKGAYTIQDNRLKAEEDAKRIAADDLKGRIRASIRQLQRDFDSIVGENNSLPDSVRLSFQDMTVDQEYFLLMQQEGARMLDEVHRECLFEAEKSEKLMWKLRNRLMNGLLIEEMPLFSIEKPSSSSSTDMPRSSRNVVYSLRTNAIDPSVSKVIALVRAQLRQQELQQSQQRANDIAQKKALEAMEDMKNRLQQKREDGGKQQKESGSANNNAQSGTSASAAIIRRQNRKDRKNEISKHEQAKPNEHDDDIRDIQAIKKAEKTMGDYKLKSSEDYEVPEDQRINANKKLKQMAMLEDSMFSMRVQFNERFLALRRLKQQLTYSIRRSNARIKEIDSELKTPDRSLELWNPVLDPLEFPEEYEEVTESELLEFMNDTVSSWENRPAVGHKVIIGNKLEILQNKKTGAFEVLRRLHPFSSILESRQELSGNLCEGELVDYTPPRTEPLRFYEIRECLLTMSMGAAGSCQEFGLVESIRSKEDKIPSLRFVKSLLKERMQIVGPSSVQQKLTSQRRQKLEFERSMIVNTTLANIAGFEDAIDDLRVERHQIVGDIKLAEFKLLTLFQEFQLLQTFESRDNQLQSKQVRCKNEEVEIASLAIDNKSKLETKQEELQQWNDKMVGFFAEFKALLPDNHPYLETLTKIFRKKIKRNKSGNDEEDEDDDDDDDAEDDEDDEDDDEEIEDICPPGCDQSVFDKILDLREKKLDTEDYCSDVQKTIDELKKAGDRLRQREKQIAKETQQTEVEVQQFQLQKQAALNQIRVVVPLRLSHVHSFRYSGKLTGPTDRPSAQDTSILPEDFNNNELVDSISLKSHVLFSLKNLRRLSERIKELHLETDDAKESFKLLHKERTQLLRDKEIKEMDTKNWRDKCKDLQMLKFGREIDLDELEQFSDRTKELEGEALLELDRQRFEDESSKMAKNVAVAKNKLVEVTKENTKLLDEISQLTNLRLSISQELNTQGPSVTNPNMLDDYREIEERKRIKAYTQFQATELDALRAELNMLKRKEAPIFTYSSPPVPPTVLLSKTAPGSITRPKEELVLPPIPSSKLNAK